LLISSLIFPLIWITYIKIQTGDIFPTSGSALRVIRGIDNKLIAPPELIIVSIKQLFYNIIDFFVIVPKLFNIVFLSLSVLSVIIGILIIKKSKTVSFSTAVYQFCIFLFSGLFLWSSYYVFYQGGFRFWYFGYVGIAVYAIYLPVLFSIFFHFSHTIKTPLIVCCILISLFSILSQRDAFAPQEYDKYKSALAANTVFNSLNPQKNIGAFNTGIYNYFMKLDVINLDGVVNPEALKALKNKEIPEYIKSKNIGYMIEHDIGEAFNLQKIYDDDRIELTKWIDLTKRYTSYKGKYSKKTYLWKISVKDEN